MKVWTEVKACLAETPADWALWIEVFDRHGIPGTVQTDQPPTLAGYAYEPNEADLAALRLELTSLGATSTEILEVPEENWAESWRQFFVPRRVGQRFVVRPTWEAYASTEGDVVLVLDPGQAFGTGDHPTTRMCLEFLEDLELAGKTVADIGCGSGILSVAARLLGSGETVGVDLDPASIESSHENADRNGVTATFMLGKGFGPLPEAAVYDIVLSNIVSAALIGLAPEVSDRVVPGGDWVVSGIIDDNWADVQLAAARAGFSLVSERRENNWVAAWFRREK